MIIDVSKDFAASHQKLAEKYGLPFVLGPDPSPVGIQLIAYSEERKTMAK